MYVVKLFAILNWTIWRNKITIGNWKTIPMSIKFELSLYRSKFGTSFAENFFSRRQTYIGSYIHMISKGIMIDIYTTVYKYLFPILSTCMSISVLPSKSKANVKSQSQKCRWTHPSNINSDMFCGRTKRPESSQVRLDM